MTLEDWTGALPPLRAIYGRFWREARWMLAGITLIVILSALGNVATPYYFSRLIDALGTRDVSTLLLWTFAGYALLRGLTTLSAQATSYLSVIAAENLNFIAATSFFEKLLHKPGSFFIEHNPVAIQTARNEGESALYVLVQIGLIALLPGILQVGLALILMGAVINWEMVLIVFVYGAVYVGLVYLSIGWTRPLLDKAIQANQDNASVIGNAVNAMETLRYFNGDRWISERFAEKAELGRRSWSGWAQRRVAMAGMLGLAAAVQLGLTFWVLLPRYEAGQLSVGDIVLINTLLLQLNQPFEMLGVAIDEIARSLARMMPFVRMWSSPEDQGRTGKGALQLTEGRLVFEHVGFAYGERQTVDDVSFTAERGTVTFLVGETGAGKSTLFKLALKALEPQSGRILIDGQDLTEVDRESWYAQVGVVPQDAVLLSDSLAVNIVLGRERDAMRLRRAAERASILSFIEQLPEGFETSVGEKGLKLSGGERQRVAIARALYADPQVLFLDEASSALDEGTEGEIMGELRSLKDRVTILAITHRRSIIQPGDRIVRLGAGSALMDREKTDENTDTGQDRL